MKPLSAPSLNRRWGAAAAGVVLLAGLLPAQAHAAPKPRNAVGATGQTAAKGEELANYDSRAALTAPARPTVTGEAAGLAAKRLAAAAKPGSPSRNLRDQLGLQGIVDLDHATGTPRRVAKLDGFLTGASHAKPAKIALDYVKAHADVFGLSAAAIDQLQLRQDYVDIAGTHHLSFIQSVGGVPVFGNGLKAHVAKDGRLVQVDGAPLASLPGSAGSSKLSAAKAREAAVQNVLGNSKAKVTSAAAGPTKVTGFADGGNAQLVMFQTATGPRLAWRVVSVDEGYVHVVDAADGTVLYRQSTVARDSASAFPNYPGAPAGGQQVSVQLGKWLPNNSPKLAGNVAHVYSDVDDDNKASPSEEISPAGKGSFTYPFSDFSAAAAETGCDAAHPCSWDPKTPNSWQKNREQNAAQLYYFLGTWHDHLKADPIGFTRAAGNFEAVDDDAVQGQAMDGANVANGLPDANHVNNANMNTLPDGTPPVMQMYLFQPVPGGPFIAGNSGDEADIVYHEYTHGLSNRLVVDVNGVSTLGSIQAGSMGEAWSDWYALDYLVGQGLEKDTAKVGDLRVGGYVGKGQNLIRTEPVDCPVGTTAADCAGTPGAGAGGYTYGDFGKVAGRPEVHADGEIWAQTLWDLRTAIGSKQALNLVTRAMELSPANPSYLDERNSILQADTIVNGGKLSAKIWNVFAKRGMGYFAGAIDGDDAQPVEDFSLPPAPGTPRGTLSGKVTDADTKAPLADAVVGFGGHASGFAGDYAATTGADGTYTITDILPGTYPKVFVRASGYDTQSRTLSVAARANAADWAVRRDWASTGGGSHVVSFDGVDYTKYGCGPAALFDQSSGSGWVSDAKLTGATAIEPRAVVLELPKAVDIAELTINPTATCGDGGSASTGDYKLETSKDGVTWTVGSQGHFTPADRKANSVALAAGSGNGVKFLRYTMLGTQVPDLQGTCPGAFSGCEDVDSTEIGVYGTPIG
ncbi:M36 family metallopeptidase [Krasilnikovia sp. MM14-A1259]|uniref:M36 family metallopeptidase n=1 Tax=Krasilnikovia sp. MM14-A1259 TaxID=3373539 RepID=UPI0038002456